MTPHFDSNKPTKTRGDLRRRVFHFYLEIVAVPV